MFLFPILILRTNQEFAEVMAKMMVSKFPKKVTTEWNTSKRKGKVFSTIIKCEGQNNSVCLLLTPTPTATVSMPISWKKIGFHLSD